MLPDGLSAWMARKGFKAVGELRGMLSVAAGTDAVAYERAGYVTGLRAANVLGGRSNDSVGRSVSGGGAVRAGRATKHGPMIAAPSTAKGRPVNSPLGESS